MTTTTHEPMTIQKAIGLISRFGHLQMEEAEDVMHQIMDGEATEAQIGAYLMALRMKGETPKKLQAVPKRCEVKQRLYLYRLKATY